MTMKVMHIGIDDTDSPKTGCTTYVAALLVERLHTLKVRFMDYPNLVRLNPNVPWKTRGNGALCLRIYYSENDEEKIKETVIATVEEYADLQCRNTNPGVVFFQRKSIPREVEAFSRNAISGITKLQNALKLLKKFQAEAIGYKKGRGIIGGLAAVGEELTNDYTYEILAYRVPENWGDKRKVNVASILEMEKDTAPYTFNNIDPETGKILITPGGPDPVFFGIRGESAQIVKKAYETIQPLEAVERWVIFRTNQGTDAHLRHVDELSQIEPHKPVIATGTVTVNPRIIPRRHVVFSIQDESMKVDCAAYEPTGSLSKAARMLITGDQIKVYGGVRARSQKLPMTINLEKFRVLKIAEKTVYHNPVCPNCGKRLKSMGHNKGFRCRKCGVRYRRFCKVGIRLKRKITEELYITSPRSQRHLTKPIRRYGMEKKSRHLEGLMDDWHSS